MATQEKSENEKTNMVFLAGNLKFDPKVWDTQVRALIDVGMKSAIQVSIFTGENAPEGNSALADKLKRFRGGDFIRVVGILRPYGVKQDDNTWKNSMSIDITQIKNLPPKREESKSKIPLDDDVPF